MYNIKDNGGPAFPVTNQTLVGMSGLTLRDWFAGMALQGALASPEEPDGVTYHEKRDKICEICYNYADSMIAARKEGA